MSEREPTYEELYAERHAPSAWWSEPRASDSRSTVEREAAQRESWRKALAAHKAEQRRLRPVPELGRHSRAVPIVVDPDATLHLAQLAVEVDDLEWGGARKGTGAGRRTK